MNLYRISIAMPDRSLSVVVKKGIIATVETGASINGLRKPKQRIALIVGDGIESETSWVQVATFDEAGAPRISHEGWTNNGHAKLLQSLSSSLGITASLAKVDNPTEEMLKCQEEAKFGPLSCCTSYGDGGCYITCCGGCCSDPVGCPGAGCCG